MSDPVKNDSQAFDRQRRNMVDSQLRPNKITDERVLAAMEALPREMFVPPVLAASAYRDEDIAVGPGRWLLEPMVLARMVQAAATQPGEKVLEVGSATGYGAALLRLMGGDVYALDSDVELTTRAEALLRKLGLTVSFAVGALTEGLPKHAPYDVIFVHGAVMRVPETWTAQLAEGGRMIVAVAEGNSAARVGKMRLILKQQGHISFRELFDANIRFLPGFAPEKGFTF